jgi:hypothetical protein
MGGGILMRPVMKHCATTVAASWRALRRTGPVLVLGGVIAASAGCGRLLGEELNPTYCSAHVADQDCRRRYPDAGGPQPCTADDQCMSPTGVCDLASTMTCVQCTQGEQDACVGATPACVANQCQGCTAHAQCVASNVCLPDGTCADLGQVAYVQAGGAGTACTKAMPCGILDDGLKTNKPIVKLGTGTIADSKTTTIDGRAVTIVAEPGARLDRTGDGVILEVKSNGADVQIFDLEITGGTGVADAAVSLIANGGVPRLALTRVKVDVNQGTGILAAAGTLTVSQSTISNNLRGGISAVGGTLTVSQSTISNNPGGGISAAGGTLMVSRNMVSGNAAGGLAITDLGTIFDIENNIIAYNGVAAGPSPSINGGVVIASNTSGSKLERNTIVFNQSSGLTYRGGLSCHAPLVSATGNLIFHNSEDDGTGQTKTDATTQKNDVGSCQYGNTLAIATDAGNLGFKSPLIAPFDFHLTSASPPTIVDAGGACSGIDVDGEARPIGAACDLGADEYHP